MSVTKIIIKQEPLSIIIPTAGISRRLKKGPKALLDFSGEKLIERQIRILKKTFPFADIVIVTGYGHEEICKVLPNFVRVVENEFFEENNVSRSISIGLRACNTDRVLVIYGDIIFSRLTFFIPNSSTIFLDSKGKSDSPGVNLEKDKVLHISYASKIKWAHSFFLQNKELELMKKIIHLKEYRKFHGHEILNLIIQTGGDFNGIYCGGPSIEVDTLSDLFRAKLSEEKL